MIILHAAWDASSGLLYIWGEDSALFSNNTRKNVHPFACKRQILENLKNLCNFENIELKKTSMELPSSAERPSPSPELIIDDYSHYNKPDRLSSWIIYTIPLNMEQALDFLIDPFSCRNENFVPGNSIRFWRTVAEFGLELLARGSYIPALQRKKGNEQIYNAVWKINLTKSDAERVAQLSKMLFPECTINQKITNYELVVSFLNMFVNAFIKKYDFNFKNNYARAIPMNIYDEWFLSLIFKDGVLKKHLGTADSFYTQMEYWSRQIENSNFDSPFRTCFKIEPGDKNDWIVHFFLQKNDDPSLLLPAKDIWKMPSFKFPSGNYENVQERLLGDIARAAIYFPPLEKSLEKKIPESISISTEKFYRFLREAVPLLKEKGFGILLPSFFQRPGHMGIRLTVKRKSGGITKGILNMNSILEYDWEVAIGDEYVSKDEFMRLAALKIPILNLKGKYVELKQEDIEKAINFFEKANKKNIQFGELIRLNLSGDSNETGLPVIEINGDEELNDILLNFKKNIRYHEISVPETLNGTLRDYQVRGLSWLVYMKEHGLGACLADDMGLGKTIQTIALILREKESNSGSGQSLVICPMSIAGNWVKEIQKFAPSLNVIVHHGNERLTGKKFLKELKNVDVVITTYGTATRDIATLSMVKWNFLVLDEAQNIKNPETKQAHAIKAINSNYRIALTGTPVENRLTELWSIMEFLNPGYLGSFSSFRKNFIIPVEKNHDAERANMLKSIVQPFILRRLKTDKSIISDLPEKMEIKVYCNLTKEQATLYEATVKDMLNKIEASEGINRKGLILSTILKLKQICNHPAHFLGDRSRLEMRSGKLERLREMIDEALSEGDRILVFTQFAEMGALLKQYLQNQFHQEVLFLHGAVSKKQRDLMIERFQSSDLYAPKIFVLSLKAGGLGLNLTAANRVFHFDRWWNPAVENQATDRAFRIGQTKNVYVYKYIVLGTIEEKVDALIESKKELAEKIIGTGEEWLTELSTDELKELFKLNRSAVEES